MPDYKFVIMTNPVEGREDEYNKWYDEQHVADVIKLPGFTGGQRFDYVDHLSAEPCPYRYIAIYDITTDDIAATMAGLVNAADKPHLPISESMSTDTAAFVYRARGPYLRA